MENMGVFGGFLWGLFGGASAEVYPHLDQLALEQEGGAVGQAPRLLHQVGHLRTLIGGGLAVAYIQSGIPLTPILAIHVGITTPLIIGAFMSQTPPTEPGGWD